jgi:hypothetical protein
MERGKPWQSQSEDINPFPSVCSDPASTPTLYAQDTTEPWAYFDIEEEEEDETGWGGEDYTKMLEEHGVMDIPSLFPRGRVRKITEGAV